MTAQPNPAAFAVARPAVVERMLIDDAKQTWNRGDGYDARDPEAPSVFCCDGCDEYRSTERTYCHSCREVTGSYLGTGARFATLNRYWTDPTFAAEQDAEREAKRAECHSHWDAIRDAGLRLLGYI